MTYTYNIIWDNDNNTKIRTNKLLTDTEIKTAFGTLDFPSYFSFRFIDSEEIKRRSLENNSLGLYVYVKEPIEWDSDKRTKGKEFLWTKEDVEKYGNFTVIRIRVIGKD